MTLMQNDSNATKCSARIAVSSQIWRSDFPEIVRNGACCFALATQAIRNTYNEYALRNTSSFRYILPDIARSLEGRQGILLFRARAKWYLRCRLSTSWLVLRSVCD
jgi:hypothetical protein